ncbi:EscE/YscE/SsaE family type III secretion system needle protein co-chaperone [Vibrio neptunius]|uniref:Type III secretion system protein, YseE family n=1 Tax=Vibrio neptunius TaxID=170651 RepID=A0ABS3A0R1_9VIBR|nr:EscE/YscE/SsaE family type III secretion system needle protein co-chaperone [Vibrio neptunius]MBN3491988.1 hypothetical protein [Vibrio neptunius]MBN3514317.1 hypothetical protein [Vibrio neptunius]MBN3548568.1 hypothetical protein [Vibrio neptunius]MBN3576614.1 hypothetical protein [Vibrio neptunius]MCH9870278.1 hypothetical protein [Vibrio neptunius]
MARITQLESTLRREPNTKDDFIVQLKNARRELNKGNSPASESLYQAIDAAQDVISILAKRYQ